jgi:transcriptional regulator
MFIPTSFRNENIAQVKTFIETNSFGILVSNNTSEKLLATHIPLEIEKNSHGKDILVGHISKANPQWENFDENRQVLAIFSGPHSYISSSWYDHQNVPTWNYVAVHVYGRISLMKEKNLIDTLGKLVAKYEKNSDKPVSVAAMSESFLNGAIKGLVGFEIEIEEIQAAYKLSQNRNAADYQNIISELEKSGDQNSAQIAAEMRKIK